MTAAAGWYIYVCTLEAALAITRSKTFRSGNSEAIRLPRNVAFGPDVELVIVRSGEVMTVYPAGSSLTDMTARLNALPRPASVESRDTEEVPDRPGL